MIEPRRGCKGAAGKPVSQRAQQPLPNRAGRNASAYTAAVISPDPVRSKTNTDSATSASEAPRHAESTRLDRRVKTSSAPAF